MTRNTPRELLDKGYITDDQFTKIEPIVSGKIISVFYELRVLLYLGILLFTSGVGILIYQNVNDIGHLFLLSALIALTGGCFYYIKRYGTPYSNFEMKGPTPYYDYIVLLASLLFISVLGYLEFLYVIFAFRPGWITLITSLIFFYVAYRFDNVGVLSLAITAMASFWSISVSPEQWYYGDLNGFEELYITAIIFAVILGVIAMTLDKQRIKQHFTFTYLNFAAIIYFVGTITGMFQDEWYGVYLILIYAGCGFAFYMAKWKKSFLFLLYAFLAAYIGTTYLLADIAIEDTAELWFFYSVLSCGGFIYFIIRFKNYFRQS